MIRSIIIALAVLGLPGAASGRETCSGTNHPRCGVYVDSGVRSADARACYERGRCDRVIVRPDGRGGIVILPRR